MKKVLVTGCKGFIGRNLTEVLNRLPSIDIKKFDIDDDHGDLFDALGDTDFIFHLAGVNRPEKDEDFRSGNVDLTKTMLDILERNNNYPPILFSSSIQAILDNSYGKSKKDAEDLLLDFASRHGSKVYVFRLPNVFGKWSRPNYNSVVATFCHNISHGLEITISDPDREITLVYIDDVIREFLRLFSGDESDTAKERLFSVNKVFTIRLGELAEKIYALKNIRNSLVIPDLSDDFTRYLHATYSSFADSRDLSQPLNTLTDARGSLTELFKSVSFGQVFISKSHPGIMRGNHYHDSKVEKFCVIQGTALIKLRNLLTDKTVEYKVTGGEIEIIDIPAGYSHSIENLGDDELIVLFWANEIFDPSKPDTYASKVAK